MNYVGELCEDKELMEGNKKILIYGAGGYGDKIFRNLMFYGKSKDVKAFVDKDISKQGKTLHHLPVISVEKAKEESCEAIMVIGGAEGNIKDIELLDKIQNLHGIVFNTNCKLYGTEYGGFYLPKNMQIKNIVTYSFGIGEDLSFIKI